MGQPIAVRTDFTAVEVRRLARRAKGSDQVRRLLAIAALPDGASPAEAAKVGRMDRQTLRDLGDPLQRARARWSDQCPRASCAGGNSTRSTGHFWRGSWTKGDPGHSRHGALAGL
jgi:hypothetical protein